MNLNMQIFHVKKMKKYNKHKFKYLFLEGHNYTKWFDIQDDIEIDDEESDYDFPPMSPLDDKKVLTMSPLGYKKRLI